MASMRACLSGCGFLCKNYFYFFLFYFSDISLSSVLSSLTSGGRRGREQKQVVFDGEFMRKFIHICM